MTVEEGAAQKRFLDSDHAYFQNAPKRKDGEKPIMGECKRKMLSQSLSLQQQ
jgi:hypothetical protein